jgi:hypothetical protein
MTKVRIKNGYEDAGREGVLLAGPIADCKDQLWLVVQWDGQDDPDLHKASGIEMAVIQWQSVEPLKARAYPGLPEGK